MSTTTPASCYAPGEGGWLALILVAGAMGLAVLMGSHNADSKARNEKFNAHLQSRNCVAAIMDGRHIATYRCDSPTAGEYVSAAKLYHQANDVAEEGAAAPQSPRP